MNPVPAHHPEKLARTVGILYLVLFVVGPFAFLFGKANMLVPGDPAATVANIAASESVFRLGMAAEATVFIIEIVVAAMLYVLFRPVSRHWSLAGALARFGQAVIQGVNLLTSALALLVIGGTGYLAAFEPRQLDALVSLFLEANAFMVHVWGLFFGVHLAILGWLVYRSGFMPKVLGTLLAIASAGYLLEGLGNVVVPGTADFLAVLVVVLSIPGELAFTAWLLVRGVDATRWDERDLVAV